MSGWDVGPVTYSDLNLAPVPGADTRNEHLVATRKFREFLRNYREGNIFVYREKLRQNYNMGKYLVEVDVEDLSATYGALASDLLERPGEFLPLCELAAKEVLKDTVHMEEVHDIQVTLVRKDARPIPIRELNSSCISKVVQIPGIIISASRTRAKATHIFIMCKGCGETKVLPCRPGFGGATLPRTCDRARPPNDPSAKCPVDPYVILPDKSKYIDQQSLKLQESPETVPTGEMPRNVLLSVDRSLVDMVIPGTRVTVMGIYSIFATGDKNRATAAVAVRTPYIRVVGIAVDEHGAGRATSMFTPDEEAEFSRMARQDDIYGRLSRSIAPSIFGHEDIRKALACQLMGGSRKRLPDGMRLRGDINILLLGDPSTAKSQFLKFIEKVAPVGVYTSGKGSSAAGLTASVVRDSSSGEFYLEGGAMVLADGGIVCIDEFDKMREEDRVAIHEAMEQQTISIAKAGITTILNSRTSVLAAANPVFGRYDDMKTAAEQIDFASTILSRFDMIFIVKDIRNEERDRTLAEHVINVHRGTAAVSDTDIDIQLMKRFISYCRTKCAPRLSDEAAEALRNHYVSIRSSVRRTQLESDQQSAIPITVRQLEAIVRLSEALAKMSLAVTANVQHVHEAIRLFRVSTLDAANSGLSQGDLSLSADAQQVVQNIEVLLKRRLPMNATYSERKVVEDFVEQGFSEFAVRRAIYIMLQRDELEYRKHRTFLHRKR